MSRRWKFGRISGIGLVLVMIASMVGGLLGIATAGSPEGKEPGYVLPPEPPQGELEVASPIDMTPTGFFYPTGISPTAPIGKHLSRLLT